MTGPAGAVVRRPRRLAGQAGRLEAPGQRWQRDV
jgi:hypothetical protein